MEIVNNRYKIVREIHYGLRNVLSFVVMDFHNDNKTVGLSIILPGDLPPISKDYILKNFLQIVEMPNECFFSNYDFGSTLFEIDGRMQKVFYYTYELRESYQLLFDYVDPLDVEKILKVVVRICQIQNLAILNGFVHPIDTVEDFYVDDADTHLMIKATDLVTLAINEKNYTSDYQFVNVAALILNLFDGYNETKSVFENIDRIGKIYSQYFLSEYQNKIVQVILKICSNICFGAYGSIINDFYYRIIADINSELNSFFYVDTDDVNSYICRRPATTSQDKDLNTVLEIIRHYDAKNNKNIFFVTGNLGCGKSQFLKRLSFLSNFETVDCYPIILVEHSDTFFLQLISTVLAKYPNLKNEINLNSIYMQIKKFNSQQTSRDESKYELISKISGIFKKISHIRPQVIIVDNFNLIDKFTVEFIFSNLMQGLQSLKIYFVCAFSRDFQNAPSYFKGAYSTLVSNPDCLNISLKPLNQFEIGQLIKDMLRMRNAPLIIACEITKITGGNPFFAVQLLNRLIQDSELWKNRSEGYWEMDSTVYNISHFFDVPRTILQFARRVFPQYFEPEKTFYKSIFIFQIVLKKEYINKLLPEFSDDHVETIFNDLLTNHFISELGPGIFHIDEKILQVALYASLSDTEKDVLHRKAIEILKDETEEIFYDELLLHYDYIGDKEQVIKLLLSKARDLAKNGQYRDSIINYEKVLNTISNTAFDERTNISSELGSIYLKLGRLNAALAVFQQIEDVVSSNIDNSETKLKFYLTYCEVLYEMGDLNNLSKYLTIVDSILKSNVELSEDENILNEKVHAMNNILVGDFSTAINQLHNLVAMIKKTGNGKRSLSELYRLIGNINVYKNSYREAMDYFEQSYRQATDYDDIRDMLGALNNIANVAMLRQHDLEQAESTYNETVNLAINAGFDQIAMLCYANLAMLNLLKGKLDTAEYYITLTIEKIILLNFTAGGCYFYTMVLQYELLIRNNDYIRALTQRFTLNSFLEKNRDNVLIADNLIDFYQDSANLYVALGDYDISLEYLKLAQQKTTNASHCEILIFEQQLVELISGKINSDTKIKVNLLVLIKKLSSQDLFRLFTMTIWLLFVGIGLHKFELLRSIAEIVVQQVKGMFDKTILSNVRLKFIQAQLDKENAGNLLTEALSLSHGSNVLSTEIAIKTQIALNYFEERKYAFGVLTCISVQKLIIQLMSRVPTDHATQVFNLYALKAPFQITFEFLNHGATAVDPKIFDEKVSEVGLKRLLASDDIRLFLHNKDFLEILLSEVFYANDWVLRYRTLKETVSHFTSDYAYNIKLVLNLMMQKLFAVYSNIVRVDEHGMESFVFVAEDKVVSYMDYAATLKTEGFDGLITMLDRFNFEVISIPLNSNRLTDDITHYTMIFVVHRYISILSKRWVKFCEDLAPFVLSLLEIYNTTNSLISDETSGALIAEHFQKRLAASIEQATTKNIPITVCYFAIENTKAISYFLGQSTLDIVVKNVIDIVTVNIQSVDVIGRYANDEFAIMFYGASKNIVMQKVEKIKNRIMNFNFDTNGLPVTMAFGIASLNESGVLPNNIVDCAYTAMVYAKDLGVNKVAVYYPSYDLTTSVQSTLAGLYSRNLNYSFNRINCFLELLVSSSGYVSKNAMIAVFLQRLLEYMQVETVSLVNYTDVADDSAANQMPTITTVTAVGHENMDVTINMHYINRAMETLIGFFTKEVELTQLDELVFSTWRSVLVCPIFNGTKIKGVLYITENFENKHFTNDDLGFVALAALLLEKEL